VVGRAAATPGACDSPDRPGARPGRTDGGAPVLGVNRDRCAGARIRPANRSCPQSTAAVLVPRTRCR